MACPSSSTPVLVNPLLVTTARSVIDRTPPPPITALVTVAALLAALLIIVLLVGVLLLVVLLFGVLPLFLIRRDIPRDDVINPARGVNDAHAEVHTRIGVAVDDSNPPLRLLSESSVLVPANPVSVSELIAAALRGPPHTPGTRRKCMALV
ncbi:hypothetical protein JKP88DRAFT_326509 [Tribonema minus]|uniref:Uncharacterized protein n=1 Tax=Tribonema minus TaxID=303371 RepID=A0A836CBE4_9STRA|nr:hypothetical protein JKP88DRAFT_326509 [Tribonema minus]